MRGYAVSQPTERQRRLANEDVQPEEEIDSRYRWWAGAARRNGRLVGIGTGYQRRDERHDRRQPVGDRCDSRIAVSRECRSQLSVAAGTTFPIRSGRVAGLVFTRLRSFRLGGSHFAVRAPISLGNVRIGCRCQGFRGDGRRATTDRRAADTRQKYPECQENPCRHIRIIACPACKENTGSKSALPDKRLSGVLFGHESGKTLDRRGSQ